MRAILVVETRAHQEASMPDISTIVLFIVASLALLVVPGPTIILVITRSLAQGRAVALPLVLGVGLGDLVAAALSLAGAGALLATSATAFMLVKVVGAFYLIWLGVKMYRTDPVMPDVSTESSPVPGRGDAVAALRDGFLVTVFNPKGVLFFVAFVPQFIDPARDYISQAVFFAFTFVALAMLNGTLYALGADRARSLINSAGTLRQVNRAGGVFVAAAGVLALFTRRPSA